MALSRKFLKGMGIEDEKIDPIIEAHRDTVDGLTSERDALREKAEMVPDLQKQLEDAKAADHTAELQSKLDEAVQAKETAEAALAEANKSLDDYKAEVQAEKDAAAKAGAYRKQILEAAGIAQNYLDDVMGVTKLDAIEMDDEGKIKDADKLVETAKEKWGSFVVKEKTDPADVQTPPNNDGNNVPEGAHARAVQIAKERHERLYGKSEE